MSLTSDEGGALLVRGTIVPGFHKGYLRDGVFAGRYLRLTDGTTPRKIPQARKAELSCMAGSRRRSTNRQTKTFPDLSRLGLSLTHLFRDRRTNLQSALWWLFRLFPSTFLVQAEAAKKVLKAGIGTQAIEQQVRG